MDRVVAEKKGCGNLKLHSLCVVYIFMTVVYGISTGFGKFATSIIDEDKIV